MTAVAATVEARHPDGPRSAKTDSKSASGALRAGTVAVGVAAVALGITGAAQAANGTGSAAAVRLALIAGWAIAGLVIAVRGRPRLGLVTAAAAAVGGVCTATADHRGASGVHAVAAILVVAAALHFELALPDGQLATTARQRMAVAAWVAAVVVGVGLAAADVSPSGWAISAAVGGVLLLGLPAANRRYVRTAGLDRQRLQLIGCGAVVVVEGVIVVGALRLLVDWPRPAATVAACLTLALPLALALGSSAAVTRQVERVLLHTVSLTGLTGVVIAIYMLVVVGLGRSPAAGERSVLLLSMLAAAAVAIAYLPARVRLTELANRIVYGERHPPDEVLRTWGSRLSRAIPMDELLLQLAESLRKVMSLRRAEVWTGTGSQLELTVSVPDREAAPIVLGPEDRPVVARAGVAGNAWMEVWLPALLAGRENAQLRVAPASHSGHVLGLLVVERAGQADGFGEADEQVLSELARQVGLALHTVQLDSALQESLDEVKRTNEELRASRARIVATSDAERRKIERNLHDGAQQHLVALAVNLRLARDMLGDDPAAASEILEALADAVKDTIQELRDLAHGIYPPLLMDSGLPEALRAAANRSPLPVEVEVDGIGRFPAEVEAALYFCCLEALQNAAKHAPNASVIIRVVYDGTDLRFAVADDGPGFDVARGKAGHGYVNMSDRLGAIGGSVEWTSAPGRGTTISGTVPAALA